MDDSFLRVLWEPGLPASPFLVGDRVTWCKGTLSRQAEIRTALRERFGQERPIVRSYGWLCREPDNAVDANAIAVYIGRHKVGFVPAPMAAIFAPHLDDLLTQLRLGDPLLGHASCLVTFQTVRDGAWIVGLIGPWPPSESRDEFWKPDREPTVRGAATPKTIAKLRGKATDKGRAIARLLRQGMTRAELIEAVGEPPGKTAETVTKKCTRHVLHFDEDVMRSGRYLLKVTLEDGVVVSWAREHDGG